MNCAQGKYNDRLIRPTFKPIPRSTRCGHITWTSDEGKSLRQKKPLEDFVARRFAWTISLTRERIVCTQYNIMYYNIVPYYGMGCIIL